MDTVTPMQDDRDLNHGLVVLVQVRSSELQLVFNMVSETLHVERKYEKH